MAEAKGAYVFVETENDFKLALENLSRHQEIAFDAEGVNLGRGGSLTVISLLAMDGEYPAYVIDVQTLGGARVFSKELLSLRTLLESSTITKVTFDCRMDSDALLHLFGVKLQGVSDLQVLDQAIRIQRGEAPPQKCLYIRRSDKPNLKSMATVAQSYPAQDMKKMDPPHQKDTKVWEKRPLAETSIQYASQDVHVIKALCLAMRKVSLTAQLTEATRKHSARYEKHRRDQQGDYDANYMKEEVAIIDSASLPREHPRKEPPRSGRDGEKWDEAILYLCSGKRSQQVYNCVMFVLQHEDWYTDEARRKILSLADSYPYFSAKQREKIANPPSLAPDVSDYSGED